MKKFILKGIAASPGIAQGVVKIVKGHEDTDSFKEGYILVTRITDPTMVIMMGKAKAIVCDIGGITSHPAIVSREMGIPSVVGTQLATKKLKDGMQIEVDGAGGEIFLLGDKERASKACPEWVDKYARASYLLFKGNVLEALQPIDLYHFYPLWYDLLIDRIYQAILKMEKEGLSFKQIKNQLPPPSGARSFLVKVIAAFPHLKNKEKDKFIKVINFLVDVLGRQCHKDIFGSNVNVVHKKHEIDSIINNSQLDKISPQLLLEIGRLYMGLGHLINGLYNDVVTDMAWEVYGPYNVSHKLGSNTKLLIKEFNNLRPKELWPEAKGFKHQRIILYSVYKDTDIHIRFVGCHILYSKPPVESKLLYGIDIDGSFVNELQKIQEEKDYYLSLASSHYRKVKDLSFEEKKQKVMLQECYLFHQLFRRLKVDWRPTKEMQERIKGKDLTKGLYTHGKVINYQEYCREFGIDYLKKVLTQ